MDKQEIDGFFEDSEGYKSNMLETDGKKIWNSFLNKLRTAHSFDENNTYDFEKSIIDSHIANRFEYIEETVKDFFTKLRAS